MADASKVVTEFCKAWEGNVVINERVDQMTIEGRKIALPVVGVFELQGDKIKAWRDSFDRGMARG